MLALHCNDLRDALLAGAVIPTEKIANRIRGEAVEEGFAEIVRELAAEKKKGKLTEKSVQEALKDLKEGRGKALTLREIQIFKKELKVDTKGKPVPTYTQPRTTSSGSSATGRAASKSRPGFWKIVKKNKTPFAVLGGLVALSGLGLGAAHAMGRNSYFEKQKNKR